MNRSQAKEPTHTLVIPDGEADPGPHGAAAHMRNKVPALRFALAGITAFWRKFIETCVCIGSPNLHLPSIQVR